MSDYAPGQSVDWLSSVDGVWHPGIVAFDCCQASANGGYVLVVDENGWGQLCAPWDLRPVGLAAKKMLRRPAPRPAVEPHPVPPALRAAATRRGLRVSPGMPISKLRAKGGLG